MRGEDVTEQERARYAQEATRYARERLEASRRHLTDALRALSVPKPDWVAATAAMDMAVDVMPGLRWSRHGDD